MLAAFGGRGEKAAAELKEYNRKMLRYLRYRRELGKWGWKVLHREYGKERKEKE